MAVSEDGKSNENTVVLRSAIRVVDSLNAVAEKKGGLLGVQLAYCPAYNDRPIKWRSRQVPHMLDFHRKSLMRLSAKNIQVILDAFTVSAKTLSDIGIRAVQIHAAHGYFMHQLTSPFLNLRKDEFGWNGNGVAEFLDAFSKSTELPVVRLSFNDGAGMGYDVRFKNQMDLFRSFGFRVFDISNGIYWLDKNLIYPSSSGLVSEFLVRLEPSDSCVYIVNGMVDSEIIRFNSKMENVIWGAGRALIADPLFFERISNEDLGNLKKCQLCGHCHYFSRKRSGVTCPVGFNETVESGFIDGIKC